MFQIKFADLNDTYNYVINKLYVQWAVLEIIKVWFQYHVKYMD
jgi:hypothetical protein